MKSNIDILLEIMDKRKLALNNDYNKINYTYYSMFCSHYESFFILIQNNLFSSAILLLRTMFELYVKSYYLEFIEKEKKTSITDCLDDKRGFISFFEYQKITYTTQQVTDILKTAKGLFETLSLLLMYVQGFNDEVKLLVNRFQEEQS